MGEPEELSEEGRAGGAAAGGSGQSHGGLPQREADQRNAPVDDRPGRSLARKGKGKEAKLSYAGHVLMENRNGLVVNVRLTQAIPPRVRAVFTKHIEPTIERLVEHYWEEFRRLFGRIRGRPDSDPILQLGRGTLNEAQQGLRDDWYSKVELEATELE